METELPVREDATLAAVRRRGLLYLNYVFWALALGAALLAANVASSLFGRWIDLLQGLRRTLGIPAPVLGPDYWVLGGAASALIAVGFGIALLWRLYRRAWNRRLAGTWPAGLRSSHARIRRLRLVADPGELAGRAEYLGALAASPEWSGVAMPLADTRETYEQAAAIALKVLEVEVVQRAVTAGLVVGLNRNPLVDSVSILAAALELQFFVLTRLGKRPSLATWMEMLKRTGSSLFLNWYVSRGDALYLKLAIKKSAWGLGVASDLTEHAAGALEDVDWDDVAGGLGFVPEPALHVMSALGSVTAMGMTVGAFGMRQLGTFIEATADDLLQGVLAGGILYYHGMALAAECLSLDAQHRAGVEMNRTIPQAMSVACAPAGRILLEQVRAMRQFLRKRRRLMFTAAKDAARQTAATAAGSVRAASSRMAGGLKSAVTDAYGKITGES